jgi:apolipoprotein N-acyltransferase
MSLVRQVEGNLSIAVDPYGRVLAQTDYFGATDRTLVAQVPVEDVPTLYSTFGRWLAGPAWPGSYSSSPSSSPGC